MAEQSTMWTNTLAVSNTRRIRSILQTTNHFELISPMMMSNPPSSLPQQRLHRRQQSTPVAFEAMKVQMPPTTTVRNNNSNLHRRGQSFDMSRSPIRRQHQRTGSAVSINTNTAMLYGQQILREAQQQRLARPGQYSSIDISSQPQCGSIQQSSQPGTPYDMSMNATMILPNMDQQFQYQDMQSIPMSAGSQFKFEFEDENHQHYFQPQHRPSDNVTAQSIADRRGSQPDLRVETGLRPYTPTQAIQNATFPLTPISTPLHAQHQPHMMHFQQPTHQSPAQWPQHNDTILSPKPVSMTKSRSLQGIAEHQEVHSFSNQFIPNKMQQEHLKPIRPAHVKNKSLSSLKNETKPLFGELEADLPKLDSNLLPDLSAPNCPSSPSKLALSPRRMSISDLNLEPGIQASIEETNVTLDDIAQFIDGPDNEDNKWVCKFEGCGKRFGRKENIKSHVQTHLGDRQFRCDHCQKCFVRGHDLKRHAKIHTGKKAYACLCGNAFARHDALTRHRQRGMCIGAFEGIVRKEIKRGRPRKHRPEMDDRVDKASRTRRNKNDRHGTQSDAYASSASSCSMSSWGSPPTDTMDNLSIHGSSPAYDENMGLFEMPMNNYSIQESLEVNTMGSQISLPPNMFSFTPPASPGYSTGNKPSPTYRELTPTELASIGIPSDVQDFAEQTNAVNANAHALPELLESSQIPDYKPGTTSAAMNSFSAFDNSLAASQQSQHSLPALSHSSSPPPTDALAFDFGDDSMNNPLRMSTMSNMSSISSAFKQAANDFADNASRNDFDNFLDYATMGLDTSGGDDSFFANL